MLLAWAPGELAALAARAEALRAAGLPARLLDAAALRAAEPALAVPQWGGALQLASDSQIVRRCCRCC
jgi:glycine/D-amino acid oxidase-like deaminating enzyme